MYVRHRHFLCYLWQPLFVDRCVIPMKYGSVGRAIVIALLFVAAPGLSANEKPADTSVVNRVGLNQFNQSGVVIAPATQAIEDSAVVADSELRADQRKDKLTVFFAIGLVINIILMSFFGIWAVRQWRKSSNRG